MLKRIITSIIALPFIITIIFAGGPLLKALVTAIVLVGMHEFYSAYGIEKRSLHYIGYFFATIYCFFVEKIFYTANFFPLFTMFFLTGLLVYTVIFYKQSGIREVVVTFFGFFYVCFLLMHFYLIREYTYGQYFIWLVLICAWGSDTSAYFTGIKLGRHKLIPELSPKKTIEGAVGGVIGATLLATIYAFIVEKTFMLTNVNIFLLSALTGSLGSVFAQLGDLAASAIKRYTNIKDFGNIVPGHGGVLDRFDSVILTAPIVYYVMVWLIKINI